MIKKHVYLSALVFGSMLASSGASAYSIDGDMQDWLAAKPITRSAADWTPNAQIAAQGSWTEEDWNGVGNVGEGGGGQYYDAEAMYLDWDQDNLYVAIITGHKPTDSTWGPGDLAVHFGSPPISAYKYGVELTGNSEDGGRNAAGNSVYVDGFTVGGVYNVTEWGSGLSGNTAGDPTSILAVNGDKSSPLGVADLEYGVANYNGTTFEESGSSSGPDNLWGLYGNQTSYDGHYFIEAAIPVAAFGSDWNSDGDNTISLHWTMNCANDDINLTYNIPNQNTGGQVPEPASIALMGLGLVGMARVRRKSKAA